MALSVDFDSTRKVYIQNDERYEISEEENIRCKLLVDSWLCVALG